MPCVHFFLFFFFEVRFRRKNDNYISHSKFQGLPIGTTSPCRGSQPRPNFEGPSELLLYLCCRDLEFSYQSRKQSLKKKWYIPRQYLGTGWFASCIVFYEQFPFAVRSGVAHLTVHCTYRIGAHWRSRGRVHSPREQGTRACLLGWLARQLVDTLDALDLDT